MTEYKLYHADCFEKMKDIPNNSIDLIVTDPPYLIPTINGGGSINNVQKLNKSLNNLKRKCDITLGYDIKSMAEEVNRIQKDINAYFFCNKAQIKEYLDVYVGEYKCKFDIICWHKNNALPTYSNKYLSDTEYILFFHNGKGHTHPNNYESAKTWFIQPINYRDKKLYNHPTIKPLNIVKTLIENSSEKGDTILDMFVGSGTTCIAAYELGRKSIGIEKDDEYFRISSERIENRLKEAKENLFMEKNLK